MVFLDGDIIPYVSGQSSLGINSSTGSAFDISSLRPFNNIHQISGIWHDPQFGQSGVIRFNQAAGAFQASIDGGLTFQNISLGTAGGVTSLGVIGDTDLTGNIDLVSPASGFIVIEDTANSSPLLFSVNTPSLSGLWGFPEQGFNGKVVNSFTDFNGTTSHGALTVVGASGIYVDIIGQTMTITPGNTLPKIIGQDFTSVRSVTVSHNLNTSDVIVQVKDSNGYVIIPDDIQSTNVNTVVVTFNNLRTGRITIIGG
jgi:hypothetical protein